MEEWEYTQLLCSSAQFTVFGSLESLLLWEVFLHPYEALSSCVISHNLDVLWGMYPQTSRNFSLMTMSYSETKY